MRNIVFPFDSYVSPLYDASAKKVDEYILMVELQDVPYKVCREVSVPSNLYVGYLGEVLVITMGWVNYHLHEISKDGFYYMRPYNLEDKDMLAYDEDKVRDAFQYTVADIVSRKGSSFELVYDFGDFWKHKVTCLGKRKRSGYAVVDDPGIEVLSGEGCCPPDDCGGTYGYRDLLSTMADPSNEEYESMKGWLQGVWGYGDFDPLAFDLHSCRLRVDDYQRLIEEVRRGLFRR